MSIGVTFMLSSANAFNLDVSEILFFGKELTLSQTTNFKLFQTESLQTAILYLLEMAQSDILW